VEQSLTGWQPATGPSVDDDDWRQTSISAMEDVDNDDDGDYQLTVDTPGRQRAITRPQAFSDDVS